MSDLVPCYSCYKTSINSSAAGELMRSSDGTLGANSNVKIYFQKSSKGKRTLNILLSPILSYIEDYSQRLNHIFFFPSSSYPLKWKKKISQ